MPNGHWFGEPSRRVCGRCEGIHGGSLSASSRNWIVRTTGGCQPPSRSPSCSRNTGAAKFRVLRSIFSAIPRKRAKETVKMSDTGSKTETQRDHDPPCGDWAAAALLCHNFLRTSTSTSGAVAACKAFPENRNAAALNPPGRPGKRQDLGRATSLDPGTSASPATAGQGSSSWTCFQPCKSVPCFALSGCRRFARLLSHQEFNVSLGAESHFVHGRHRPPLL